ncbi:MAG: hypothetical protein H6850_03910 [Alphaproteobacteria bacterium]|nr:MAG: hypothetical protein H6850_03910 [Alphaproteobacteria bacterium]
MAGSCNNGVMQSFIPALVMVIVFGELLFYLLNMTIIMVGNFFNYNFPIEYWDVIEFSIPPAAVLFFSLLMQKYGDVPNMFPHKSIDKSMLEAKPSVDLLRG